MILDKNAYSEILNKKVYFLDLDGTIYLENKLFKGVHELLTLFHKYDKHFFFLSNNSSLSTAQYLKKLNKLDLNINLSNIILSQHPTLDYLRQEKYKRVFLLGNKSLRQEFEDEGFKLDEEDPEILVLAFDQEFTYQRLLKASKFLQKRIPYIATHLDNRCPTLSGYIPDAGAIAALLNKTTNRYPKVFGKPNKNMLLFKLKSLNMHPKDAIMIGDRLYTDIRMGIEAGVSTCCVLSGESTLELISESEYKPDYVINGIWELIPIFENL